MNLLPTVTFNAYLEVKALINMLNPCMKLQILTGEQYTVISVHTLICTGAFLPLIRYMYEPSTHYSTIIRQGVLTASKTGTLQVLACIYKDENLPGILRLLESFHPTYEKPIPIFALQLINLATDRVSLPVLAPFHKLQSCSTFVLYLTRCNRIVTSTLALERRTHGAARLQHYISLSSYTVMHNDICNLAHEKGVNLIILPFHVQHTNEFVQGWTQHSSQSIRDVNKLVLDKSPCSVGIIIDRGDPNVTHLKNLYHVAIFFIGGKDDHEALAYTTIFTNHPSIRLTVVWLKPRISEGNKCEDFEVIQDFHNRCNDNERVTFQEMIVRDGAETTEIVVSMKDDIDLVVVGKYHEPMCAPLFGLSERWSEYPELGVFGDMLVTPDFDFSVLVVQQEPHRTKKSEEEEDNDD